MDRRANVQTDETSQYRVNHVCVGVFLQIKEPISGGSDVLEGQSGKSGAKGG